MPAFLPKDSIISEQGPMFIDGENVPKMMEDSPDGLIHVPGDGNDIVLELKCPFPNKTMLPVHYQVPVYYAMQVLTHMTVTKTSSVWYGSYCAQSTALIHLKYCPEIWESCFSKLKELFDKPIQEIEMPKRKPFYKEELKTAIQTYLAANSTLVCEVPSLRVRKNEHEMQKGDDGFLIGEKMEYKEVQKKFIASKLRVALSSAEQLIQEAYELQRRKSTEILAFILSDIDRIHDGEKPNQMPVAYALKGYSLCTDTLRKMISEVRKACCENGIKVVCDVMDGQWAKVVVRSKDGKPLTKIQYNKDIWNRLTKHNKQSAIGILNGYSKLAKKCIQEIAQMHFYSDVKQTVGNFSVEMQRDEDGQKKLYASSVGMPLKDIPMIAHIYTTTLPQAWKLTSKKEEKPEKEESNVDVVDVLSLLPRYIVHEIMEDSEQNPITDEDHELALEEIENDGLESLNNEDLPPSTTPNEDFVPINQPGTSQNEQNTSANYPTTPNHLSTTPIDQARPTLNNVGPSGHEKNVLKDILCSLQNSRRGNKWSELQLTEKQFYLDYLCNASVIEKSFIVLELDLIITSYEKSAERKLPIKKSDLKGKKVNIISELFGDKSKVQQKANKMYQPVSLMKLCDKKIHEKMYPKAVLTAALCKVHTIENPNEWTDQSTIPMNISTCKGEIVHKSYCFPEYSEERKQLEHRLLDPTHILTNMRTHCTNKNMPLCRRDSFRKVSREHPEILSRAIVDEMVDKQSAEIALTFFSQDVEMQMYINEVFMMEEESKKPVHLRKKVTMSSDFVRGIRDWYLACDARGYTPQQRIEMLQNFYDMLTENYPLEEFPPPTGYVLGIPIVTYEAILQNTTLRIILYTMVKENTYCQRAISTLQVETFFGDLQSMEFSGIGCPKSTDIPKLLAHVIQLNHHRLDAKR